MVLCSNCGAARDADQRLCTNCRMDSGTLHIPLTQKSAPKKSESRGCNNCGCMFDSTLPKCPHCRFPVVAEASAFSSDISARLREGLERGGERFFPLNPLKGTLSVACSKEKSPSGDLGEKEPAKNLLLETKSQLQAS